MPKPKKKLVIIDGNALVHRAWHALPPTMRTKKGEIVNAVYGFTTTILKMYKDLKPDYVAATFDLAGPTFRHEAYEDYKATRVKQADELYAQIPRIKEVVTAFNIPIYEIEGYEADDVIATIVKHKTSADVESIIVTGDMDTLQLVNDSTKVYTMRKGVSDTQVFDETEVKNRLGGLTPKQVVDYKALRGDPSDNIPGVRGIGDKGAITLLNEFKTLDNLYQNINSPKISPRYQVLLAEHKADAFMSRELAQLDDKVPINFRLQDTQAKPVDLQKIIPLFQELEFKSLIAKLPLDLRTQTLTQEIAEQKTVTALDNGARYELIDTDKKCAAFLKKLQKQKVFAVDTETSSLDPLSAKLLGVSISWQENEAYYVISEKLIKKIQPILENEKIKKVGHNIKFDLHALQTAGFKLRGVIFDTMLASYLLNPGSRQHGLDGLIFSEFGYQMQPITDLIGTGRKQVTLESIDVSRVSNYACEDADYTWRLYQRLSPQLKEKDSQQLLDDIEVPLIYVLADMERRGILLDSAFLKKLSKKITEELNILEVTIHQIAGVEFNIASPKQLKEVLFETLKISTQGLGKTKTGISTAAAELEKMRGSHEIIEHILRFRELSKLKNTYLDALPKLTDQKGRIHTSYNQTIAATGRLSSSDPNLQNIPIKTELGREIRKAFVAPNGFQLIAADYSQFELRIIASLAKDKKMIAAFKNGDDIHAQTAAEIFGVKMAEVTKAQRSTAKAINFGILYGQGAWGLAQTSGLSRNEASEYISTYFAMHPEIEKYLEQTKQQAKKLGYVETIFGRRRYLPEINSSMQMVKAGAERAAINHPIQGTQADLIKMAMITIAKELPSVSANSAMLLQVHDELVFEVPNKEVKTVAEFVKKTMESVYRLDVPIEVSVGVGKNWGELENFKI